MISPLPPLARPLAGLRFGLVGAGRVGRSLAAWARAAGAELRCAAARPSSPAPDWIVASGTAWQTLDELDTAGLDLLLLAIPDPAYADVAVPLATRPPATVVLMTSGCAPLADLAPLGAAGSALGVLHPLRAFPGGAPDSGAAATTFCALAGEAAAVALAGRLVAAWGGTSAGLEEEQRLLYHGAATLAAGGIATLLAAARDLAGRLGLPAAAARGYDALALGALEAAVLAPQPATAITGPAARGDWALVERQAAAAAALVPDLGTLLRCLARTTARLRGAPPADSPGTAD